MIIRGDTHRHTDTGHFEISTESFGNVNRLIGPPLLQSKTFCRKKKNETRLGVDRVKAWN